MDELRSDRGARVWRFLIVFWVVCAIAIGLAIWPGYTGEHVHGNDHRLGWPSRSANDLTTHRALEIPMGQQLSWDLDTITCAPFKRIAGMQEVTDIHCSLKPNPCPTQLHAALAEATKRLEAKLTDVPPATIPECQTPLTPMAMWECLDRRVFAWQFSYVEEARQILEACQP